MGSLVEVVNVVLLL